MRPRSIKACIRLSASVHLAIVTWLGLSSCAFCQEDISAWVEQRRQPPRVISARDAVGLTDVVVGDRCWTTGTDWRCSEDRWRLDGDGLGWPMPFLFLEKSIVVSQDNFVLERGYERGHVVNDVVLSLPEPPRALCRMPDLAGWAWMQEQLWVGTPSVVYVSSKPPSETEAKSGAVIRKFVGQTRNKFLSKRTAERIRLEGLLFRILTSSPNAQRMLGQSGLAGNLWDTSAKELVQVADLPPSYWGTPNYDICDRRWAFSADSRWLVTSGLFGQSRSVTTFYSADSGEEVAEVTQMSTSRVRGVRCSPDGTSVLLFHSKGVESVAGFFEVAMPPSLAFTDWNENEVVVDGAFATQGKRIFLVTRNRGDTVGFWDWNAKNHQETLGLETGEVEDIAVSPDGKALAVATEKKIHFFDIATRKPVGGDAYEHPKVKRIRFANDNKHFASLGADGELRVWTLDFMEQIDPLKVAPQYDGQSF